MYKNNTFYLVAPVFFAISMLVSALFGSIGPAVAAPVAKYVGSDKCESCHPMQFYDFKKNGHGYKLNKVEDGEMPEYPFTNLKGVLKGISDDDVDTKKAKDAVKGTDNPSGTPKSYSEISYVIGGFGWKARFIDKEGYIITGSKVQYNLKNKTYSGYHNNETGKKYNCGNCHTTGWKRTTSKDKGDTRNTDRQDNLPGMDGTFAQPGVQCEACHGAGSIHIKSGKPGTITRVAKGRTTADFLADDMGYGKAVACGECHTRDGEKDYPSYISNYEKATKKKNVLGGRINAKKGNIRHHEQYDELLGIDPDKAAASSTRSDLFRKVKLACINCHNVHTTTKYQDISGDMPGMKIDCVTCHSNKATVSDHKSETTCIDCHMPKITKSAIKTTKGDEFAPSMGDVRTHIFKIDLKKDEQYTDDGKFAYPRITPAFGCKGCHSKAGGEKIINDYSKITVHK